MGDSTTQAVTGQAVAANWETWFVFALVAVAAALFASGRLRYDVIALGVVLALALSGILTASEAVSGFGNTVVILIAGLMVIGEALNRTGVTYMIGDALVRIGGSNETRLITLVMIAGATLGAFMSSTAVVAIFIPVLVSIAISTGVSARRLLMPLSFGALISGMMTLIGTPPNLIISGELQERGYEGFAFFDFLPVGVPVLIGAIVFMLFVGRRMLPPGEGPGRVANLRNIPGLLEEYGATPSLQVLRVPGQSRIIGQTLGSSGLAEEEGVRVVLIERQARFGPSVRAVPGDAALLRPGDLLLLRCAPERVQEVATRFGLETAAIGEARADLWRNESGVAAVLIHPDSDAIGRTIRRLALRDRYGVEALGIRRRGKALEDFDSQRLRPGDSMLVTGPWNRIAALQSLTSEFVVLHLPVEKDKVAPARDRAPVALALLAGIVVLSALNIMPVVIATLLAVLLAVGTRCLTMDNGYRAINWNSIVLIAGMLPVAVAMERTGGVSLIVDGLMNRFGDAGPQVMMSAFFFLTAGFSLVLSNTATAVIVAPIAIAAAEALGLQPHAFAMAVAIAASAGFATPVSSPVVTLVVAPGRYRFMDFVKIGTPLILLAWLVTLVVVPMLFPFQPG